MKRLPPDLEMQIRRHLAGLPENEALTVLAQIVRPDVIASCVDAPRGRREAFTTSIPPSGKRTIPPVPVTKPKPTGRLALTDADREGIRRLGLDPEMVARTREACDLGEFRRLREEART